MYGIRVRVSTGVVVFALSLAFVAAASAQSTEATSADRQQAPAPQDPHAGHQMPQSMPEHEMPGMAFSARDASGTAWQPESSPMYGVQLTTAGWQVMLHGNAFAQFLHESGDRGSDQGGSINWIMGMARREIGGGRFGLRGMLSLEPLTIPGCGYPNLLATGEQCDGASIHDRQHPHDFMMELAAEYDRPLSGQVRLQVYGGPVGEPALGPVAFPHRVSAMPNPVAPIAHHWLDSTHITYGVVTGGVYGPRWKAEASVFNGREPDEHRWGLEAGALDSVSGRVWFMPNKSLALQFSAGALEEAESSHDGGPPVDVDRLTASATWHRPLSDDRFWATTIAWGRNAEAGSASNALLVETNLQLRPRQHWFGRLELAGKPAHDLDVHDIEGNVDVAKLQGGYTRYFADWRRLTPGIGGSISTGIVPSSLEDAYGRRANFGFALFVTLRPAKHRM